MWRRARDKGIHGLIDVSEWTWKYAWRISHREPPRNLLRLSRSQGRCWRRSIHLVCASAESRAAVTPEREGKTFPVPVSFSVIENESVESAFDNYSWTSSHQRPV